MAIKQVASINSPNQLLNRFMAEVQKVNTVLECPLLNGNLVKDVSITAGTPVDVNHGLGRMPQGWFVVGIGSASSVFATGVNKSVLTLDASADTTVNLWVF